MEKENTGPFSEYGSSPLIDGISKLFQSIGNSIGLLLKAVWTGFIFSFHFVLSRWLTFGVFIVSFSVLGIIFQSLSPKRYVNYLELKPQFSIESQLINDIGFLNSLIETEDTIQLAKFLNLDVHLASQIEKIKLETKHLETEKLKFFDGFISTLDSVIIKNIDFKELITDKTLESAYSRYLIEVYSTDPNVFSSFEEAILKLINRNSAILKEQSEWLYNLESKKELLTEKVLELDTLKDLVKTTMVKASEAPRGDQSNIVLEGGMNSASNEYLSGLESIFNRAERYNENISMINMKLASEGDILRVQTKFSPQGTLISPSRTLVALIGGLIGFLIYSLYFIVKWIYRKGEQL